MKIKTVPSQPRPGWNNKIDNKIGSHETIQKKLKANLDEEKIWSIIGTELRNENDL